MDKYNVFKEKNKIFFLIKTTNEYNLKDIIRSRTNVFQLSSFTKNEYSKILNLLLKKNNINLNQDCIQYIFKYSKYKHKFYKYNYNKIIVIG